MNTRIDALGHLPSVYASPWKYFRGRHDRYVSFNCEHGNRRHAILRVYDNGGPTHQITVKIDGRGRYMSVGEPIDPFSTANETLVAFSRDCNCHNELNGESL